MSERARLFLSFALFALALIAAPLILSGSAARTMLCLGCVAIVFALSYNMLLGQTGLLSFGHAVYYGLAGFAAIHAMNALTAARAPVPLPFIPLVGALAGLVFGVLFGAISTRRAGTVFAMISLGLGELVSAAALIMRGAFGGEEGISTDRTKLPPFFGYKFGTQIEVYYLIAFWCFVSVALMYALTRTPFGRMSNAVRDNPERAEFVGYSTRRVRFLSFVFSATFAGVAGSLGAIYFELVNAQSLGALQSGSVLLMTFVGGVGHFFGPILGAILISAMQLSLADITKAWQLYFGLMFIFVVMFWPGGIAGFLSAHAPLLRGGRILRLAPVYGLLAIPIAGLFAGMIALVETAHATLVEKEPAHVFGLTLDGGQPVTWAAIAALLGVSIVLYRLFWPRVTQTWAQVWAQVGAQNPGETA